MPEDSDLKRDNVLRNWRAPKLEITFPNWSNANSCGDNSCAGDPFGSSAFGAGSGWAVRASVDAAGLFTWIVFPQ